MGKLKKGEIKELPKLKRQFWLREWEYSINGVVLGTVFKQEYQGQKPMIIYRFMLKEMRLIQCYWKEVPKGEIGITSEHYKSKKEALRALKKAIKTYIKLFKSLEI